MKENRKKLNKQQKRGKISTIVAPFCNVFLYYFLKILKKLKNKLRAIKPHLKKDGCNIRKKVSIDFICVLWLFFSEEFEKYVD